MMSAAKRHIGLFTYGLTTGGVSRRMATLANALADRGNQVDLLLACGDNAAGIEIHDQVRVIGFRSWRSFFSVKRLKRRQQFAQALNPLAAHMREAGLDVLISSGIHANITALRAREKAGAQVRQHMPLIITERAHTSTFIANKPNAKVREQFKADILRYYPLADAIVGVSEGVSADMVDMGLPVDLVQTLYNPVIGPETGARAAEPVDHPWFQPGQPPVVLGVGRLTEQKDFPTLLRAFARLIDAGRDLRLVILGSEKWSEDKDEILAVAASLGIQDRFDLPGSVPNPFAYLAKSAFFACSSKWEGLPAMLIEALAVGTPVVSTDCPSGPREILNDGELGHLVPVGDHEALAAAMAETLDDPPKAERLIRSTDRFTIKASVESYLSLVDDLQAKAAA
ncbi:MAG: glycosyltransferase [Geminicoccaceae bacterium]